MTVAIHYQWTGYVYVLTSGDQCKIGCSMWPSLRAKDLQKQLGRPMELVFELGQKPFREAMILERRAHKRLDKRRVSSHPRGEWFYVKPRTAINAIKKALIEIESERQRKGKKR